MKHLVEAMGGCVGVQSAVGKLPDAVDRLWESYWEAFDHQPAETTELGVI